MSAKKRVVFVVDPVQDADLIACLNAQANMSAFIRAAIYEKIGHKPADRAGTLPQPAVDTAALADLVRQAVRAEFTIAQFTLGSGRPSATQTQDAEPPAEDPGVTAMMDGLWG